MQKSFIKLFSAGFSNSVVTFGVDPEEDLVALQGSLQALYVKNISTLEGACIKERWATAELTKLKGQVKEAHSRANCVIKQAKKEKMKALAKNKIDRKETRVSVQPDRQHGRLSQQGQFRGVSSVCGECRRIAQFGGPHP